MTDSEPTHLVTDLIVNLRKEPTLHRGGYTKDLLQETQLLKGDRVTSLERQGEWVYVEVLDQKRFTKESGWGGYRGWLPLPSLRELTHSDPTPAHFVSSPYLTYQGDPFLFGCGVPQPFDRSSCVDTAAVNRWSVEKKREHLLTLAHLFLGAPYLWGGCSFYLPQLTHVSTSVDCSGLVYLLYRVLGVFLPRNAHDQYLALSPIEGELQPGDLVFYREEEERPDYVTHVLLVKDTATLIEATTQTHTVRETPFKGRFTSMEKVSFGRVFEGEG